MKKSLIALAVLAAAGAASAQSSVTLYGLMDVYAGAVKSNSPVLNADGKVVNVVSTTQDKVDSGALNGSRWGIKGSEDLGGGLKAIFNLESGINADNGSAAQGGLLFGRRAVVGLNGDFGTVEVGRNSSAYDSVSSDHAMSGALNGTLWGQSGIADPSNTNNGLSTKTAAGLASATATTSAASAAAFLGRTQTWLGYQTRFNNSIKYTTPTVNGFSGAFMYALGEDKTATTDSSKSVSGFLKYVNGPLWVSAGYQSEAAGGSLGTDSLVKIGKAPALQNTLVSVNYDFGVARVGLGLNRAQYKDVAAPVALGGGDFAAQNEYNLSVAVPVGAVTLSASYAAGKGDTLGKSSGFGLQALYPLSKRTTLYVGGVSTSTFDKLAAYERGLGADIQHNTTYAAGMRHTF